MVSLNTESLRLGETVKILPHTDLFMMGETIATVEKVGRKYVHVRGFRSGRLFRMRFSSVTRA